MIAILCFLVIIGFGWGLNNEFSEQRRLGRMAKNFKEQAGGKKV